MLKLESCNEDGAMLGEGPREIVLLWFNSMSVRTRCGHCPPFFRDSGN